MFIYIYNNKKNSNIYNISKEAGGYPNGTGEKSDVQFQKTNQTLSSFKTDIFLTPKYELRKLIYKHITRDTQIIPQSRPLPT